MSVTPPYKDPISNLNLADTFYTWYRRTNDIVQKLNPLEIYGITASQIPGLDGLIVTLNDEDGIATIGYTMPYTIGGEHVFTGGITFEGDIVVDSPAGASFMCNVQFEPQDQSPAGWVTFNSGDVQFRSGVNRVDFETPKIYIDQSSAGPNVAEVSVVGSNINTSTTDIDIDLGNSASPYNFIIRGTPWGEHGPVVTVTPEETSFTNSVARFDALGTSNMSEVIFTSDTSIDARSPSVKFRNGDGGDRQLIFNENYVTFSGNDATWTFSNAGGVFVNAPATFSNTTDFESDSVTTFNPDSTIGFSADSVTTFNDNSELHLKGEVYDATDVHPGAGFVLMSRNDKSLAFTDKQFIYASVSNDPTSWTTHWTMMYMINPMARMVGWAFGKSAWPRYVVYSRRSLLPEKYTSDPGGAPGNKNAHLFGGANHGGITFHAGLYTIICAAGASGPKADTELNHDVSNRVDRRYHGGTFSKKLARVIACGGYKTFGFPYPNRGSTWSGIGGPWVGSGTVAGPEVDAGDNRIVDQRIVDKFWYADFEYFKNGDLEQEGMYTKRLNAAGEVNPFDPTLRGGAAGGEYPLSGQLWDDNPDAYSGSHITWYGHKPASASAMWPTNMIVNPKIINWANPSNANVVKNDDHGYTSGILLCPGIYQACTSYPWDSKYYYAWRYPVPNTQYVLPSGGGLVFEDPIDLLGHEGIGAPGTISLPKGSGLVISDTNYMWTCKLKYHIPDGIRLAIKVSLHTSQTDSHRQTDTWPFSIGKNPAATGVAAGTYKNQIDPGWELHGTPIESVNLPTKDAAAETFGSDGTHEIESFEKQKAFEFSSKTRRFIFKMATTAPVVDEPTTAGWSGGQNLLSDGSGLTGHWSDRSTYDNTPITGIDDATKVSELTAGDTIYSKNVDGSGWNLTELYRDAEFGANFDLTSASVVRMVAAGCAYARHKWFPERFGAIAGTWTGDHLPTRVTRVFDELTSVWLDEWNNLWSYALANEYGNSWGAGTPEQKSTGLAHWRTEFAKYGVTGCGQDDYGLPYGTLAEISAIADEGYGGDVLKAFKGISGVAYGNGTIRDYVVPRYNQPLDSIGDPNGTWAGASVDAIGWKNGTGTDVNDNPIPADSYMYVQKNTNSWPRWIYWQSSGAGIITRSYYNDCRILAKSPYGHPRTDAPSVNENDLGYWDRVVRPLLMHEYIKNTAGAREFGRGEPIGGVFRPMELADRMHINRESMAKNHYTLKKLGPEGYWGTMEMKMAPFYFGTARSTGEYYKYRSQPILPTTFVDPAVGLVGSGNFDKEGREIVAWDRIYYSANNKEQSPWNIEESRVILDTWGELPSVTGDIYSNSEGSGIGGPNSGNSSRNDRPLRAFFNDSSTPVNSPWWHAATQEEDRGWVRHSTQFYDYNLMYRRTPNCFNWATIGTGLNDPNTGFDRIFNFGLLLTSTYGPSELQGLPGRWYQNMLPVDGITFVSVNDNNEVGGNREGYYTEFTMEDANGINWSLAKGGRTVIRRTHLHYETPRSIVVELDFVKNDPLGTDGEEYVRRGSGVPNHTNTHNPPGVASDGYLKALPEMVMNTGEITLQIPAPIGGLPIASEDDIYQIPTFKTKIVGIEINDKWKFTPQEIWAAAMFEHGFLTNGGVITDAGTRIGKLRTYNDLLDTPAGGGGGDIAAVDEWETRDGNRWYGTGWNHRNDHRIWSCANAGGEPYFAIQCKEITVQR